MSGQTCTWEFYRLGEWISSTVELLHGPKGDAHVVLLGSPGATPGATSGVSGQLLRHGPRHLPNTADEPLKMLFRDELKFPTSGVY